VLTRLVAPFVVAAALVPAIARACGGFFCDQGPMAMPVDQSGENVIFVLDDGVLEVHIQIQYDPDTNAQQFAWMIPMPEVPEFAVGSELFFQAVLNATVPTYGLTTQTEFCGEDTSFPPPGDSGGGVVKFDLPQDGPGVDIIKTASVGAFEAVVLAGQSAPELMQWLGDNGYQQDPAAEPILQEYLDEGNNIIAFKLRTGQEVAAVHPVVLRYAGPDGCVPIRLTRIAAVEDMDIRVFALAAGRSIPTNFRHVLVNPLKIDWLDLGSNYKEVVGMAVDAGGADGHAFVTEYAGRSDVVDPLAFHSPDWDASAFVGLPARDVVDVLAQQGLVGCTWSCTYRHPLVEGLLATYLPVPDGLAPDEFYSCLECYEAVIDTAAWGDGSGFATDMTARIVEPAAHARDLLQAWPYLTRMYTTISPAEMTDDPLFLVNDGLPDVANRRTADRLDTCDGDLRITLPDGREVWLDSPAWPDFPGEMPWEEDVEQMVLVGSPQSLVDNTTLIDELLAQWNAAHEPPEGTSGDTTGDTGTGGSDAPQDHGGGCGCRHVGAPGLAPLVLLLSWRRRRR